MSLIWSHARAVGGRSIIASKDTRKVGPAFSRCLYMQGLHLPAPIIENFFADIFNGDKDVITYMQRLLGYGITGLATEEKMCFFVGKGGGENSFV